MITFTWVENKELHDTLLNVARGNVVNRDQARGALARLSAEAPRLISLYVKDKKYCEDYFPTNRHGGNWSAGAPVGWVDHFTAAPFIESTLRWFSSEPRPPGSGNSSAHFVVNVDGATVQMVDPLTTIAWHATWANPNYVGCEHVNAGRVTPYNDSFLFMGKYKYKVDFERRPEHLRGAWWEPFSIAQLYTNVVLKRLMVKATGQMEIAKFVEHKHIDTKTKYDCGPLWPLKQLNGLAFKQEVNLENVQVLTEDRFLTLQNFAKLTAQINALLT
jgi:N-acetyl-anhydromuramyl-L-alanine amidase AmpD